jgi:hypothetical protein
MAVKHQSIAGQGQTIPAPAVEPLTGLQAMKRSPAEEVYRALDRVVPMGRRILLSWGTRGDVEWRVPNTTTLTGSRTHPDVLSWPTVKRWSGPITPGHFLTLKGAALPSGETQSTGLEIDTNADMVDDAYGSRGSQGHVRVTIIWYDRDGNDTTTTHEVSIPGSELEFGAEDTSAGGAFDNLLNFKIPLLAPEGVAEDVVEVERWSQHVSADITVDVRGSPRIVDASLSELPIAIAMDDARDGDRKVSMLWPGLVTDFPYATDASLVLDVAEAQARRLWPALVEWYAYTETAADYDTTTVPITTANDGAGNFENLLAAAVTSYDGDAEAGWSVSCGGYARRWAQNSPFVLRDGIAVVPVLVRVLGRVVTAGTGTFRFQTATHSYVDVTIATGASDTWNQAWGWLEVGVNPDQRKIGQARINHTGASGSLSITAFEVLCVDPDAMPVV